MQLVNRTNTFLLTYGKGSPAVGHNPLGAMSGLEGSHGMVVEWSISKGQCLLL